MKTCTECGQDKAQDAFQKSASGAGPYTACIPRLCQRIRAGQVAKGTYAPAQPSKPCVHHWLGGDDNIAMRRPLFFEEQERSPRGAEWQVCVACGEAKQVQIYDVGEDGPAEGTILMRSRAVLTAPKPQPAAITKAKQNGHSVAAAERTETATYPPAVVELPQQQAPVSTGNQALEQEIARLRYELAVMTLEVRVRDLRDELRASESDLAQLKAVSV